jgi:poly-beta-hydroxybutyrate-responsive repressor
MWFLEPALLLLLHERPAHGYTLIEQLKELGIEDAHPRIVYRTLREMETNEWVTSTWDKEKTQGPPRRVYRLAALGNEMLSLCIRGLKEMREQIDDLVDVYSKHMKQENGEFH